MSIRVLNAITDQTEVYSYLAFLAFPGMQGIEMMLSNHPWQSLVTTLSNGMPRSECTHKVTQTLTTKHIGHRPKAWNTFSRDVNIL